MVSVQVKLDWWSYSTGHANPNPLGGVRVSEECASATAARSLVLTGPFAAQCSAGVGSMGEE